jgi:hypothetical protein
VGNTGKSFYAPEANQKFARLQFINLDGPPPVIDTSQCAKIAEEIKSLQEDLKGDIDINERKRILKEIGELREQAQRISCP